LRNDGISRRLTFQALMVTPTAPTSRVTGRS
jgi:hypothetical protein